MCLNVLFLDMNAYFASVEQELRPELRGRPVGIVAVDAETTCCIAASYEAKAWGVRTGTGVRQARQLCPGLILVVARPAVYVRFHQAIVATVENCIHVDAVHSIDELSCRLMGREREPARAVEIARRIKQAISTCVGRELRCSIGLAPNRFLAKVAADMHKPDGLTVITPGDLPHLLYSLRLEDLPGIGERMLARLHRRGVRTVEQLWALSEGQLSAIWESVLGSIWWRQLRGLEVPEVPTQRRTVGHSHVLPPEQRNQVDARAVMVRMIHKAAFRLRQLGYWARRLRIDLACLGGGGWSDQAWLGLCQDTLTMLEAFDVLWNRRPQRTPLRVGVTLFDLVPEALAPRPLFPEELHRVRLARIMDRVNLKFGAHTVYFGSMFGAQNSAPMRIAFTSIPNPDLPA